MGVSGVWFAFTVFRKDAQIKASVAKNEALMEEISVVRNTMVQFVYTISNGSSDLSSIPIPVWYKIYDREADKFTMVFINRAFERKYNVSRETYIGEHDKIIWGDSIGDIFEKNDRKAFWSRTPIYAMEPDRKQRLFPVIKWRIDKGDRTFIYGMELPDEDYILRHLIE